MQAPTHNPIGLLFLRLGTHFVPIFVVLIPTSSLVAKLLGMESTAPIVIFSCLGFFASMVSIGIGIMAESKDWQLTNTKQILFQLLVGTEVAVLLVSLVMMSTDFHQDVSQYVFFGALAALLFTIIAKFLQIDLRDNPPLL